MIRLQNVQKSFDSKIVLGPIDLEFAPKKTHVLLGASGCGKTTLIRILLGLTPYDQGKVHLDHLKVTPKNQQEIARKTGYVIQQGGLFPHMTLRQNLLLAGQMQKIPLQKLEETLKELTSLMMLNEKMLTRFPRQISGGQRQRISLMRALMLNPDILVLDEPLGALDPISRFELQKELKILFNQLNKTVVMVTHDLIEASYFGHTITLLNQGRVEKHGSFETLQRAPEGSYTHRFLSASRRVEQTA